MTPESPDIEIWKLTPRDLNEEAITSILGLIKVHGTDKTSSLDLKSAVASDRSHVLIAVDEREIIGTATINILGNPGRTKGYIDDVAVNMQSRGKGIGEKLVRELMTIGEEEDCEYVDLTSSPHREAASRLYMRLGFVARDTNNYRYYSRDED